MLGRVVSKREDDPMSLQSPGHPSNGNYCLMDGDEWWTPSERTPPLPRLACYTKLSGSLSCRGRLKHDGLLLFI